MRKSVFVMSLFLALTTFSCGGEEPQVNQKSANTSVLLWFQCGFYAQDIYVSNCYALTQQQMDEMCSLQGKCTSTAYCGRVCYGRGYEPYAASAAGSTCINGGYTIRCNCACWSETPW